MDAVKAKAAVANLSLTDKVNLGTGVQWEQGMKSTTLRCPSYSFCPKVLALGTRRRSRRSPVLQASVSRVCVSLVLTLSLSNIDKSAVDSPVGVRYADLVSAFPAYVKLHNHLDMNPADISVQRDQRCCYVSTLAPEALRTVTQSASAQVQSHADEAARCGNGYRVQGQGCTRSAWSHDVRLAMDSAWQC